MTETGIQSLPSLDTWYEVTKNTSDLNLHSDFIQHREHSGGQINGIMLDINIVFTAILKSFFSFRIHIKSNLPLPVTNDPLKNFTQLIYLSQINQAMTSKSVSDKCRVYSSTSMIDPKTSEG